MSLSAIGFATVTDAQNFDRIVSLVED